MDATPKVAHEVVEDPEEHIGVELPDPWSEIGSWEKIPEDLIKVKQENDFSALTSDPKVV